MTVKIEESRSLEVHHHFLPKPSPIPSSLASTTSMEHIRLDLVRCAVLFLVLRTIDFVFSLALVGTVDLQSIQQSILAVFAAPPPDYLDSVLLLCEVYCIYITYAVLRCTWDDWNTPRRAIYLHRSHWAHILEMDEGGCILVCRSPLLTC
ncbi:hypothetical protein F4819DRAFT_410006 [Hypoxylon fuscum]|nr:hypothetical protein F4819DRAFT_410006 [Hypoxylon fuscum]